jgi:CheY-like chemotaxis protein
MTIADPGAAAPAQTVLVVDDEVLVRMAVAQQLRECGYRVVEAADADEAVIVLQHRTITMDVVVTDVEMAGSMDGFGLGAWIRQHCPAVKVILAGSESRAVKAAMELCTSGPRPGRYEPHNLLDYIRRLKATRAIRRMLGHWRDISDRARQQG